MTKCIIAINGVSKSFKDHIALENIDLTINNGEFLTLLGPSGCGKTTLLRVLAGLEQPDSGSIYINGQDVTHLPAEQRHVNMVFQSYALFPHMTVFENIAFGLRCKRLAEDLLQQRVQDALAMVKLTDFAQRVPRQLSGGQQQRVAIARAVVNEPLVLLLDEPLSALDYSLRKKMQIELKDLQRRLGITFILVTHDQEEALSMSDRVVVMNHGRIEQVGTPRDVYEEPLNLYVAGFIGEANIFDVMVHATHNDKVQIQVEEKTFFLQNKRNLMPEQTAYVLIRPEDIEVWHQDEVEDTEVMLPGIVEKFIYKGCTVDLVVRLPSGKLLYATEFFDEDDEELSYTVGEKVWWRWTPGWEVVLPHE